MAWSTTSRSRRRRWAETEARQRGASSAVGRGFRIRPGRHGRVCQSRGGAAAADPPVRPSVERAPRSRECPRAPRPAGVSSRRAGSVCRSRGGSVGRARRVSLRQRRRRRTAASRPGRLGGRVASRLGRGGCGGAARRLGRRVASRLGRGGCGSADRRPGRMVASRSGRRVWLIGGPRERRRHVRAGGPRAADEPDEGSVASGWEGCGVADDPGESRVCRRAPPSPADRGLPLPPARSDVPLSMAPSEVSRAPRVGFSRAVDGLLGSPRTGLRPRLRAESRRGPEFCGA